jgi:hypothetical protein
MGAASPRAAMSVRLRPTEASTGKRFASSTNRAPGSLPRDEDGAEEDEGGCCSACDSVLALRSSMRNVRLEARVLLALPEPLDGRMLPALPALPALPEPLEARALLALPALPALPGPLDGRVWPVLPELLDGRAWFVLPELLPLLAWVPLLEALEGLDVVGALGRRARVGGARRTAIAGEPLLVIGGAAAGVRRGAVAPMATCMADERKRGRSMPACSRRL